MGLFDDDIKKYRKMLDGKPAKKPDVWEAEIDETTGLPKYFYLNGKEIFDSDNAWSSPSGNYIIHSGWHKIDYEAIALTTKKQVLKTKRTEEILIDALVTDEGIGYAISEEGTLYTLTREKASQKKLSPDETTEARLLIPACCCIVYDEGDREYDEATDTETVIGYLKTVNLKTGATWKRKIPYSDEGLDAITTAWSIKDSSGIIEVTAPDQTVHRYGIDGKEK